MLHRLPILLLLLVAILFISFPPSDAIGSDEAEALLEIFLSNEAAFSSIGWTADTTKACGGTFQGISCLNGHIDSLTLSHMAEPLSGTIVPAYGALPYLSSLNLSYNLLDGSIPESLGNLTNLQTLYLAGNLLSGTIPDLSETKLERLFLSMNKLEGSIPEWVFTMPTLVAIDLSDNKLTGQLLNEHWSPSIALFNVANNRLNGTIPEAVVYLTQFIAGRNYLTGTLPPTLFTHKLNTLDISFNELDICGGILIKPAPKLLACSVAPQFFTSHSCNCGADFGPTCNVQPGCATCVQPKPGPQFQCSTDLGQWFANDVVVSSEMDFRGFYPLNPGTISQRTTAIIRGNLTVLPDAVVMFNMESSILVYGSVQFSGIPVIYISSANATFLQNQYDSTLTTPRYLQVARTYITTLDTTLAVPVWSPVFHLPNICEILNIEKHLFLTDFGTSLVVKYQFTSDKKFKCTPWIVVIPVVGGCLIVALMGIPAYIYFGRKKNPRKSYQAEYEPQNQKAPLLLR